VVSLLSWPCLSFFHYLFFGCILIHRFSHKKQCFRFPQQNTKTAEAKKTSLYRKNYILAQAVFNAFFPVFSWVFHHFFVPDQGFTRASLISSGETWRCREKRWTWRCIRYTMAFRRSSRDPTERRTMEENLWSKNSKPIISYILVIWLVVWNMTFVFHFIYGIILPID